MCFVLFFHVMYVIHLKCNICFLQGDSGLTGPPGIPGPPVSELYLLIYLFDYLHQLMLLLDQSSVLFKSAAGKRSMLFHRARTVAAIKTEAA